MAVSKSAVAAYRTSTAVKAAETGRFDPESLLDNCGTVYLTAPPQSQRQYAGIFVGILNRLLACAYWREARGERSAPLLVALDEAANIAPLPELDSLATTAAGSGIQLVTVWHSHSQLVARYGRAAGDAIAAAHPVIVGLPGQRDPLTLASLKDATGGDAIEGFDGLTPRAPTWRSIPDRHAVVVAGTTTPVLVDLRNDYLQGPDPSRRSTSTGLYL